MAEILTLEGTRMAIEDYGTMDAFDDGLGFVDPEALRQSIPSAIAGAGSGALYALARSFTIDKQQTVGGETVAVKTPILDRPWKRMAAAAGAGVLGGLGLWRVNRDAAMGFVGGMTSAIGNEVVEMLRGRDASAGVSGMDLADAEDDLETTASLMGPMAFAELPEEQELLGLGDAAVESETPTGFADVDTEEEIEAGVAAALS